MAVLLCPSRNKKWNPEGFSDLPLVQVWDIENIHVHVGAEKKWDEVTSVIATDVPNEKMAGGAEPHMNEGFQVEKIGDISCMVCVRVNA